MKKKYRLLHALCVYAALTSVPVLAADVGKNVSDFSVTTVKGQTLNFKTQQLKKPIYLKFWATWCSYCTEEMPHFEQSFQTYQDKMDFVAVNVGMNDSVARANKYFSRHGFQVPLVFDEFGDTVGHFNVKGTPLHVLIDKNGQVIHRSALITDALKRKLAELVKGSN